MHTCTFCGRVSPNGSVYYHMRHFCSILCADLMFPPKDRPHLTAQQYEGIDCKSAWIGARWDKPRAWERISFKLIKADRPD